MTENKLSGLAAYAVPYPLYFILSVYWAAGGTVTTLNILELEVIISVEALHMKVNKYDCLRVSCTDATLCR